MKIHACPLITKPPRRKPGRLRPGEVRFEERLQHEYGKGDLEPHQIFCPRYSVLRRRSRQATQPDWGGLHLEHL